MIGQIAKCTALVFVAAIVQVSILNRVSIVGGTPNLLLVTLVSVALVCGSVYGAGVGFFAGLVVDTATLATLGVTSLLLTLVGYWTGRYGETTGRDKQHASLVAMVAATLLYGLAALGLRFVLGEPADGASLARALPSGLVCNLLLAPAVVFGCRRALGRRDALEGTREVSLLG